MKKLYPVFIVIVCAVFSCKKSESTKAQYAKLIVGSWKSTGQNTKVYDLNTDALLKDSTIALTSTGTNRSWIEVYHENGSGYVTSLPIVKLNVATADTTSFITYSVLGNDLVIKQSIGGSTTKPILSITNIDMDLQSTNTGTLPSGWGLNVNTSYKITTSTHYVRQ